MAEEVDDLDVCGVEVEFAQLGGGRCRRLLTESWPVAFEDVSPVRRFGWSRGQGHFPGWWWSATTGRHVGFESWLERDHLMCLDFEREVVGFASQPFWLHWLDGSGWRRHAPDFFARLADGGGLVVDVRADDRIRDRDAQAFAATARACDLVGWRFRRLGIIDPVRAANLRWLSRYRHPRHGIRGEVVDELLRTFAAPRPLMAGAAEVGDTIAVLPTLFHLLWRQILHVDLTNAVLAGSSLVGPANGNSR